MSQFGLHQIIKEPVQIPENLSSCIDLVSTSLPTLIVDSGTHHAVHPNCHHQIICAKFNVQIHYSSPYTREVWHYKDSNDDLIRRAINQFNWERASENKNVDEKVLTFNKKILNILSKLYVMTDHPWLIAKIKSLVHEKIKTYKVFRKKIEKNQQS